MNSLSRHGKKLTVHFGIQVLRCSFLGTSRITPSVVMKHYNTFSFTVTSLSMSAHMILKLTRINTGQKNMEQKQTENIELNDQTKTTLEKPKKPKEQNPKLQTISHFHHFQRCVCLLSELSVLPTDCTESRPTCFLSFKYLCASLEPVASGPSKI